MPLLEYTSRGLYCPSGDFFIDPNRAVDHAIITHAHADHARRGSKQYYCVDSCTGLLRCRLGSRINVKCFPYGTKVRFGDVWVSFHPAGHILGSAQVRIERGSEVWVVSGDYKREADPTCEPFEVVSCDVFVTEATFGTPSFQWERNERTPGQQIHKWWSDNSAQGRNSLLFGYSLGKAQRILGELYPYAKRPVLIHDTIAPLAKCYVEQGVKLAPMRTLSDLSPDDDLVGELILAPPSIETSAWADRLGEYETGFASGWMQGSRSWGRSYDKGFVLSDHADWNALLQTVHETGARKVYVLHRGNGALVRELRRRNIEAYSADALKIDQLELGI